MNTSPGPEVAMSAMLMPLCSAIKPRKEKTTKPARKLVSEFTVAIMKVSLCFKMDGLVVVNILLLTFFKSST